MRRITALAAMFSMVLLSAPLYAAPIGGHTVGVEARSLGAVQGTALSSTGQTLGYVTGRLRDLMTGQLVGSTRANAVGNFSFVSLRPGSYAVELVSAAGQILGTSAIAVAAGATTTVAVAAFTALNEEGTAMSPQAPPPPFNFWPLLIGGLVAGGVVTAIVVAKNNNNNPSPSR